MNPNLPFIPDDILLLAGDLDTACLSDALDSLGIEGVLDGLQCQVQGARCVGPAYTVLYENIEGGEGFKNAANYIDAIPAGSVIVSSNNGRVDCTTWGDILTHVAKGKGIAGTLIDGAVRDIALVRALEYPLFSRAILMRSGKNRVQLKAVQVAVSISGVTVSPGDLIVADANGCVVIPQDKAIEVVTRAQAVEATERRIVAAVSSGMSLEEARQLHRYDQPWLPGTLQNTQPSPNTQVGT